MLLVLLLLFGHSHSQAIETCSNSLNGQPGHCININDCTSVVVALREQQPISSDTIKRLQSVNCGFVGKTPKICCADQLPPMTATTKKPLTGGGGGFPAVATSPRPSTGQSGQQLQPVPANHPKLRILPLDSCGVSTADKIIFGKKATLGQLPWMARLGYENRPRVISYNCGGSVISQRYVLTAAHCIDGLKLKSVLLGELDASTAIDCETQQNFKTCNPPPQVFGIEQAIIHPQYSRSPTLNDIGIIRLDRNADFSVDSVRPICLPVGSIQFRNLDKIRALTVSGWGTTENGTLSANLLFVDVPPVTNVRCKEIYLKQFKLSIIESQICAGGTTRDSCNGDSGGPLSMPDVVTGDPAPRVVQVGIVSFGPARCGTKNQPGVYTRVGHFMTWILDNIRQ